MSNHPRSRDILLGIWVTLVGCLISGCTGGQQTHTYQVRMSGDPSHGRALIESYGCGACHVVPGIHAARGDVGPSLLNFSNRSMIAGDLANSPENLVRWIRDPVAIEPKTAMPNLGVSDEQAHDIAAYLYTLR